jgi:hypothetical protein
MDFLIASGMRYRVAKDAMSAKVGSCGSPGSKGSPEICEQVLDRLLRAGWNINGCDGPYCPIGWANMHMLEAMLRRGADPNAGGTACETQVDFAAKDAPRVALLEKYGGRAMDPLTKVSCAVGRFKDGVGAGLAH